MKAELVTRDGNMFIRHNGRNHSFETKYTFKDIDGTVYNILISPRKRAYYNKQTKSGKIYRILLPKEVSDAIIQELKSEKDKVLEKEGGIK